MLFILNLFTSNYSQIIDFKYITCENRLGKHRKIWGHFYAVYTESRQKNHSRMIRQLNRNFKRLNIHKKCNVMIISK